MRKVFLGNLPKQKTRIDWKNSVGETVNFIYDDISGKVNIIGYDENKKIEFLYNGNKYSLYCTSFVNCQFKNIICKNNFIEGTIIKNLNGMRFGKLEVIDLDYNKYYNNKNTINNNHNKNNVYWICKCDCGKTKSILGSSLKNGSTTSCRMCYTFEDWCLDNNRQEYLDLWDYEINKKSPHEISSCVGGRYFFKCDRGIHESELKLISSLTSINKKSGSFNLTLSCSKCASFGQYLLDEYGDKGVEQYWSTMNEFDPFSIKKHYNGNIFIKCKSGHIDYMTTGSRFSSGCRCPVCVGQRVQPGINDIATTDKTILKYLVNKQDAYNHTRCSKDKTLCRCEHCGKERYVSFSVLSNFGFSCDVCSDGISYPNKFISCMLGQLMIEFESEKVINMIENGSKTKKRKLYDHYIQSLNCIIENHGMQHYRRSFNFKASRDINEEQANDVLKEQLAKDSGVINYISLDCRYSNMEWIRNSIMESTLPDVLNFKECDIDWDMCDIFASSSMLNNICDLWNSGKFSTGEINKLTGISTTTIIRYLKVGNKSGLCRYSAKEEKVKSGLKTAKLNGKAIQVVRDGHEIGVYVSHSELSRKAFEDLGIEISSSTIANRVNDGKEYNGFKFFNFPRQNK